MLWQLAFCMVIEAIAFYVLHRLSHEWLYQFHKVHHEYKVTSVWAAAHSHPLDYIIGGMIPAGLGPKILGRHMHYLTYVIWYVGDNAGLSGGHARDTRVIAITNSSGFRMFHFQQAQSITRSITPKTLATMDRHSALRIRLWERTKPITVIE